MKRPFAIAAAICALTFATARTHATAQEDRPLDPKVIAWDKGPDKIDVSRYPADMKAKYKVLVEQCGTKCHTLARTVNCDFVLEDEWERYIKKMMRRSGRLITPEQAQDVFEFVLYDAKTRKKALYDQKVAAAR